MNANSELREVQGPSALGGGWRRFFDLLWLMSITEFKRHYFGTVLGYLWSLIRPLTMFAILLFVFTQIFRLGSGVPNYPVMLLLNIVVYSFFQEATQNAVTSVVSQEGVVRKTQFPRLVIPMSVVITGLLNLAINLLVVFIFIVAWGVEPSWTWLFFPLLIALIFVLTSAMAMLLSALYVRFRDILIIWTVLTSVLFYGTPILYPIEIVPEQFRAVMAVNPLTPIFEQMRHWILDPNAPTAVEAVGNGFKLLPAAAIFIGVCILGYMIFRREAPRIAEEL